MKRLTRLLVILITAFVLTVPVLAYADDKVDNSKDMISGAYGDNNADVAKNATLPNYIMYALIILGTMQVVGTIAVITSVATVNKNTVRSLKDTLESQMNNSSGQLKDTLELFADTNTNNNKSIIEKVQGLIEELRAWQAIDNKNKGQYANLTKQLSEINDTLRDMELASANRHTEVQVSLARLEGGRSKRMKE